MVDVTIPHLKHFFQAPLRPQVILGGIGDLKDIGVEPVYGGWRPLSSSRLFYNRPWWQNTDPKSFPPLAWRGSKRAACPWRESFLYLAHALDQLEEITHEPKHRNSYVYDAATQRFEFCIELFWEIFRQIGKERGREPLSQKDVVRMAYALELIDNRSIWLGMIKKRNKTSHSYTPTLTQEIYDYIPFYYGVMKKTYEALAGRM
jgi:nucleotidyltransferase substrate binding protein (TIGR01987 family)